MRIQSCGQKLENKLRDNINTEIHTNNHKKHKK